MSQATLTEDVADAPPSTVVAEPLATVRLDELIVGRPLTRPLVDHNGVLLLSAGSMITSEFKRILQQRQITSIRVHETDLHRVTLTSADAHEISLTGAVTADSAVATQLDKVIDSGLMVFHNTGPSFQTQVVYHGRKAYDAEKRQALSAKRADSEKSLNESIKSTLQGRSVSSSVVNQLATNFLADIADDGDCVLSVAMEAATDPSIADHCFKMSMLATSIAIEMGMNEENCRRVCVAGLVHDWGMARVPAELRNARHILSEHEFFAIKKHPIYTAEILDRMPGIPSLVPLIAYQVHERPNGTGYPRARSGDRIHILAKILGAADVFVALTEEKPYRRPLAPYSAMEALVRLAQSRDLDPQVVRAMLKSICLFPIGSFVALSDGSVAQVIRRNGGDYAHPIVQRIQNADGSKPPAGDDTSIINLAESELTVTQALPTPGRNETLLDESILHPKRS